MNMFTQYSCKEDELFTRNPGWLIQKGKLILHTKVGMRYACELLKQAEKLKLLWQASNEDNPYADRALLLLEDHLFITHQELDKHEQEYQRKLEEFSAVSLELVTSQKPFVLQLRFLNIYSFKIGVLIGHFDRLARYVLSIHNLSFNNSTSLSQTFHELGTPLRKLFEIPKQWKPFKVNRMDIQTNNEIAKLAQIHFGIILDNRILNHEIRPQFIANSHRT